MTTGKIIKNSIILSVVLLLICGLIYPIVMTGISKVIFGKQSEGSIVTYKGKAVGSELLGQNFTDQRFFHGRISAVNYNTYTKADKTPDKHGKTAYTGVSSGSQNLAPSSKALIERVKHDMKAFIETHPGTKKSDIPEDLMTSSGSGLDPEISVKAAQIEISLIAKKTGLSETELIKIVNKCTRGRSFGIFGEPGVNVLKCNIEIAKKLNL
jgi:K+-transporting ATPase ATPase C chain